MEDEAKKFYIDLIKNHNEQVFFRGGFNTIIPLWLAQDAVRMGIDIDNYYIDLLSIPPKPNAKNTRTTRRRKALRR